MVKNGNEEEDMFENKFFTGSLNFRLKFKQ